MRKISCLIVDDEPAALEMVRRYAEKTPFLQMEGAFLNSLEVLEYLEQHIAPDLIFLDIQMPDLNGMELAKMLPESTKIIFTTAFDKYAIDGYKVNAVDYLLKPIDYAEFLTAANKVKEKLYIADKSDNIPREEQEDFIFVKSEYKQLKINLSDILYIEGLKDYVKIYLNTEPTPLLSLISLKKFEELLPSHQFMRVHRSYIVALNKIDQIERSQVIIRSERINIAEQYKDAFHEFIKKKSI